MMNACTVSHVTADLHAVRAASPLDAMFTGTKAA